MTSLKKITKKRDRLFAKYIRESERAFARTSEDRIKMRQHLICHRQGLAPTTGIEQPDTAHKGESEFNLGKMVFFSKWNP
ncbi:unnamed protein product [Clonostachys chloroleuca]|uniref:Uncharacterized protein n=1 Tax=Clonostachys chloroleuca TaxID=1926264 RepID=A0AA35Q914_9HYPO|nr:unnamed protein product [Clonostachys chloroleuca]